MTLAPIDIENIKSGVTWKHPVVMAIATAISTLVAIYAVIIAPVAPFPGVSGLYFAAAIYVPLSLWLGIWGCLAGYFSQLLLGFVTTPFGTWNILWAFADFMEGLIVLVAFRLLKEDIDIGFYMKRPNVLKILLVSLVANLILSAIAIILSLTTIWLITLIITITLSICLFLANPSRPWLIYVVFGIFGASLISALIGIGIPIIGGFELAGSFWTGFFGWFAGDLIILAAISTILLVVLTRYIKNSSIFVKNWFS